MKEFLVQASNYTFYVTKEKDGPNVSVLKFWKFLLNDLRVQRLSLPPCVEVHAYSRYPIATLANVEYGAKCGRYGLQRELEPGLDTRMMVEIAMDTTLTMFPHVTSFHLSDFSAKWCPPLRSKIRLDTLGLLTKGTSWYERSFGARLERASVAEQWTRLKILFGQGVDVTSEEFHQVVNALHYRSSVEERLQLDAVLENTRDLTWHNMFSRLLQLGCQVFTDHVVQTLNQIFQIPNGELWTICRTRSHQVFIERI